MAENEGGGELEVGEFLKFTANDDIHLEILLRLPDFFSVLDCSSVCRRWGRVIGHTKFSLMFQQRLRGSATSTPLTLLLIKSGCSAYGYRYRHIMKFLSSESLSMPSLAALLRHLRSNGSHYLDFLPQWQDSVVKASCNDLLLVQFPSQRLCVCNPVTRQWLWLPQPRRFMKFHYYTYALASDPISGRGYRVVLFKPSSVSVYNSETQEWEEDLPIPPEPEETVHHTAWKVTTQDGVVYSPVEEMRMGFVLKKIIVFDPFDPSGRTLSVGLPPGFKAGWRAIGYRAQIWVVRGRLRLWQAYWDKVKNGGSFVFRLWKLRLHSREWVPLQNLALTRTGDMLTPESFVLALHEDDNDTFYVADNRPFLWQYHIGSGRSQKIDCAFSSTEQPCFRAFPLVYPHWPTDVV